MCCLVDLNRTTSSEDTVILFAFNSGSIPNRRPSPLPNLGIFSISSFRVEVITVATQILKNLVTRFTGSRHGWESFVEQTGFLQLHTDKGRKAMLVWALTAIFGKCFGTDWSQLMGISYLDRNWTKAEEIRIVGMNIIVAAHRLLFLIS